MSRGKELDKKKEPAASTCKLLERRCVKCLMATPLMDTSVKSMVDKSRLSLRKSSMSSSSKTNNRPTSLADRKTGWAPR